MRGRLIVYFLLFLLLTDLTYSFVQHLSMPLDGDMAAGVVPAEDVKPVLSDPFGISVIADNAVYPNPNRFFAHWSYYTYFNHVPLWLQYFVGPIDSVYLSCAISKIILQVVLIAFLAFCIAGRQQILNADFLTAAVLIFPLFQTNGYHSYMGIIDPSITYAFFYSLPCAALLIFYFPFYSDSRFGTRILQRRFIWMLFFPLAIFIVFNGALNPGILLVVNLLFGAKCFFEVDRTFPFGQRITHTLRRLPKTHLFFFSITSLLSLYALYIGTNNSIFLNETISIGERYSRIPLGIYTLVTTKMGWPILLGVIGINIFLLRRSIHEIEIKKTLRFFSWIGCFSFFYILLLPLGGYKEYRPYILRYDTIMPITLGMVFMYGMSSYLLIRKFVGVAKRIYLSLIVAVALIFSFSDQPEFDKNTCEKTALERISESIDNVILVDNDCTVLSWGKIADPEKSELNGQLLLKLRITTSVKHYYQRKE